MTKQKGHIVTSEAPDCKGVWLAAIDFLFRQKTYGLDKDTFFLVASMLKAAFCPDVRL